MPLACVPPLDEATLDASVNIVAQMGIEPLLQALDTGCDVVLAGRCYDPAVFAAPAIRRGFDPGLALHMGKILECAAIAATPGSGADCALGTLKKDSFILETLNPKRAFTKASTAAHTLYEKSDPYHLPGPGGSIDLTECTFTELPGGRVEVRGSRHIDSDTYYVKLEGVRRAGFRTISVAGTRDPIMIASIDSILEAVDGPGARHPEGREDRRPGLCSTSTAGTASWALWSPTPRVRGHELGLVIEAVAPTERESESLCSLTRSTLLHYGYPGRIATAGNLAFPFSPSDVKMGEVFEFSIYHLMPVKDQGIFQIRMVRV